MAKKYEVVAIDLDDVLVQFTAGAMRVHGAMFDVDTHPRMRWELAEILGISVQQFWEKINATPLFWVDLAPHSWGLGVMTLAHEIADKVIILSHAGGHPDAHYGKRVWAQRHILTHFQDVKLCLVEDKWLLSRPGRLLIDDKEENVRDWRAMGGRAVLFPQPWNSNHELCADPISAVLRMVETDDEVKNA